jgi:hypothetical protein
MAGCLRCKVNCAPFQSLEAANKWVYIHEQGRNISDG